MPDKEKIAHHAAIDTFAEVIEKLGIDRVRDVFPELNMEGQTNTKTKKRILEEVARRLGVQLKVENSPQKLNGYRSYALQFVIAQFIQRRGAGSAATPIVGGASCPALVMNHRTTTPHRSTA